MKVKKVFLAIFLAFILAFLPSCAKKQESNQAEIIKGYFTSEVSVVSKDGKLSFVLSDEKVTVTSKGLLQGAELYFKDGEAKAKLGEYEISLPKTYVSSISEVFDVYKAIKSGKDSFTLENGKMLFNDSTLYLSGEELIFKTNNKEFIIKQIKDDKNEKDQSNN